MKTIFFLTFLLLSSLCLQAQNKVIADTIVPSKGNENKQLKEIKKVKAELHSDATGSQTGNNMLFDSTTQNKYADLLNDDSIYNRKYPIWIPIVEVFASNLAVFAMDRYLFKFAYSKEVSVQTWGSNAKAGWEFDTDKFGINFIGHPYSGSLTFNAARSTGYNYWQSFPFAVAGSLMWEYLGENTRPSYNDLINTPISGAFLGEILYRLSSKLLDDRSHGMQRVLREVAAGIINPARGFNRIIQRKAFRKTNVEVYQNEPVNITLYGGMQKLTDHRKDIFKAGTANAILNLQLDYGNPFECRTRKPFDFFKFRIDLSYGAGRKILDNITGYGIITGKNFEADSGHQAMLLGFFQYYDYWDNKTFELGTIGFGEGIITKYPLGKESKSHLYTSLHIAVVPFAGSSTKFVPDTSQFRDYSFGGGMEGKFETTINFSQHATATVVAYYYWIHSFVGLRENNFITIIKPRFTVRIIKSLSIGFEEAFYNNKVHAIDLPLIHTSRTEQKIFIMMYLEDQQRKGHYN